MRHKTIIVAIDPDVTKSGVAMYNRFRDTLLLLNLPFAELVNYVRELHDEVGDQLAVIIEAGWLNKAHWHLSGRPSPHKAAAMGNAVGRNHETGRKLVEMFDFMGVEVKEVRPLRKVWRGVEGKITADEFRQLTGYDKRSNQDARDAALLLYAHTTIPRRKGGGL